MRRQPTNVNPRASVSRGHAPDSREQSGSAATASQSEPRDDAPQSDKQDLEKQDYERLAELRHALRRFSRHTELEARRYGVSPQQYLLLLAIKGFPGREQANITELAERLQIRHNAVIGLVNRAEAHGLVARVLDADRSDRRVVLVRLTPAGERVLQALAEALRSERGRVRTAVEAVSEL